MENLHVLLKSYGFQCHKSEPTEDDYENYYEICQRLGRTDIEFTPMLQSVYTLPISEFSTLFVEKKIVGNKIRYTRYDFYKERKLDYSGSNTVKVYAENMKYMQAFYCLQRYLKKFEKVRGANDEV